MRLSQTAADGTPTGATTSYLTDPAMPFAVVALETDPHGSVTAYCYGDDLLRMDRTTGVYYYVYDGLGSTRALTDTTGTITDAWTHDAFGSPTRLWGSTPNSFLFNGQQFDSNLGLLLSSPAVASATSFFVLETGLHFSGGNRL